MENSILWYQPAELSSNDVIVVNGKIVDEPSKCKEKFHELKYYADKVIGKKRPWCGRIENVFFMKGYLALSDERGRALSFMFISDAPQPMDSLKISLSAIGAELDEQSRKCVLDREKLPRTITYSLIGIALVLLIFIVIACYGE